MSTCTKWVNRFVIQCKNWSTMVDYECTQWADEGSNQCSRWADEGSNQCAEWGKDCHWYTFWNCVVEWFCKAWYWVAKWVCKAWYWVAKWVCKAFAWVVKTVCIVFSWGLELVCVAWDWLRCAILAIVDAIVSLFGGRRRQRAKIDRIFVLILENRSFDHMFAFSGLRGVGIDGQPTSIDVATTVDTNLANGVPVAVNAPADFALKNVDKDPPHEFRDALAALCGVAAGPYDPAAGYPPIDNSGFAQHYVDKGGASAARALSCFAPEQLPVLTTLAREFAICDAWFSSLPGPTWPNRFFAMAASSGSLDDSPSKLDVVASVTVGGYRFYNGTIFDKLDDRCIEWKVVEGDEFPVAFALAGMNLNALQGRFQDFDDFVEAVGRADFGPKFVFIEPQYGESTFGATGPGDYTCGNSMHPLDDVTRGERLIKRTYEAIRNSPYWERSMLIVTFDEHGGFYDHARPPPAPPPGDVAVDDYNHFGFRFDQLGVRVPALVISPWVRRGTIDHTTYDHTSILATTERLFGMGAITGRDAAAADLLHLVSLDAARTDAPTTLPEPAVNPDPIGCSDEPESEDQLLLRRAELRLARRDLDGQVERSVPVESGSTQLGFAQVALMKVLQTAEYPERERWIEQFRAIQTRQDAELFVVEAKLKIRHDLDFKRPRTTDPPRQASRRSEL
ncbi:alkaline phosphatase family protein [Reyranella sp.]|uniref:alkaline phosphatase family protein n=1 Tax=Reyranella sp. TaxID=1929291 RepID=UPI003BAA1A36